MSINIFKTIKEGDSMLDLTKNILSNLTFYLEHMDFLNNIGFSKETLMGYKEKLEQVFNCYTSKTIPSWFEKYNAYFLMSSDFPYINSYLDFCFSFCDLVDMVLSIDKKYRNEQLIDIHPINSQVVKITFLSLYNGNLRQDALQKKDWLKIKNELKR